MTFSEDEVAKAKELKRLKLYDRVTSFPSIGSYLSTRHCPEGCVELTCDVFLITHPRETQKDIVWLPTLDEALSMSRELGISFSQITDYLHRRRFADGREREGVYQLLIEHLR